ncbi:hypothetical protein ACFL6F_02620, partial [Planctomycetota bacterium]
MKHIYLLIVTLLIAGFVFPAPAPVTFTKKPTAKREGDKVKIEFKVSSETDVAVYILGKDNNIIRHLAAGVLGKNPPPPLKANSLSQSIEWDRKDDDGKKVAGNVKVRVAAGLKADYASTAFQKESGPNHIGGVIGLAAGSDGRVYVMDDRSGWLYWPAKAIHVFRRDGSYEKTIKPFPAHLPPARLKPSKAFINDRGFLNPVIHRTQGMTFYPFEDERVRQMAVTPQGQIVFPVVPSQAPKTSNPRNRGRAAHLAAIDTDGGIPFAHYAGPALGKLNWFAESWYKVQGPCLQSGSDGKRVYIVGIGHMFYKKGYH